MRKLIVLILVAAGLLLLTPAVASASTLTLKGLAKTVAALQKTEKSQASAIKSLQDKVTSQAATIATLQSVVGASAADGLQKSVATIAANPVLTLSWLPTYLSLDTSAENGLGAPNIVFRGANVQVESSTSETDDSGTGNLIVGWDDTTAGATRTGSNNLVCGDLNSFDSFGGFVAGYANSVAAAYASVSGGANNFAENSYTSVSGGHANAAQSFGATISGGDGVDLNVPSPTVYAWSAGGTFHNP